jgi:uncharacterized repeat protein (TIGR04076 family)
MCADAWNAIAPYVMTLRHGGNLPWAEREGMVEIHCPDPKGITLLIERLEDEGADKDICERKP